MENPVFIDYYPNNIAIRFNDYQNIQRVLYHQLLYSHIIM